MNISISSLSSPRWYSILILLPLVIIQNLAYGSTTASVVQFIFLLECDGFGPSSNDTIKFPVPRCEYGPPFEVNTLSANTLMCIVVANILAILVSGLYAHELDTGDRKKAMGYAASIQLLGSIWGVFARTSKPEQSVL